MPQIALIIPETIESITRPVSHSIIFRLAELLNFPNNTQLIFPGGTETIPQTGSTLGYVGEPTNFNSNSRLNIELIENFVDDTSLNTAVFKKDFPTIFNDNDLNIKIFPIYSTTELVLNMTFTASSKVAAEQFRDYIKLKANELRQQINHEVDYHYSLPDDFIFLLYDIWTLRESVAGYGDSFSQYIQKYITERATNISTQTGTQNLIAIREHQINILGWFDFDVYPDIAEKSGDNGNFDIKFTYRVQYEKVIACRCEYELVIHNQLMPDKWYGKKLASGDLTSDPFNYSNIQSSLSTKYFNYFSNLFNNKQCDEPLNGFITPFFDDWVPATIKFNTLRLLDCMIVVDTTNVRFLLNLNELGDYQFTSSILAYLNSEYQYLNTYQQSLIYIQLFIDDYYTSDNNIFIDNQLNVFCNFDLDLRKRYHLRISIINDFNTLTSVALERFRSYGQSSVDLITGLQCLITNEINPPILLANKYIKKSDLEKINDDLNSYKSRGFFKLNYNTRTLSNFFVVTKD